MPPRFLLFLFCFIVHSTFAQQNTSLEKEKDVIDVAQTVFNKPWIKRDTTKKKAGRIYF